MRKLDKGEKNSSFIQKWRERGEEQKETFWKSEKEKLIYGPRERDQLQFQQKKPNFKND